jgi:hypothetical protein
MFMLCLATEMPSFSNVGFTTFKVDAVNSRYFQAEVILDGQGKQRLS